MKRSLRSGWGALFGLALMAVGLAGCLGKSPVTNPAPADPATGPHPSVVWNCARSIYDQREIYPDYLSPHDPGQYPEGTFDLLDVCPDVNYSADAFIRVRCEPSEGLRIYVWDDWFWADFCWGKPFDPTKHPHILAYAENIILSPNSPTIVYLTDNQGGGHTWKVKVMTNGNVNNYEMVWGFASESPDDWNRQAP